MKERPQHTFRFAGRSLETGKRTLLMGILNITPDSFYDGGKFLNSDSAVLRAEELISAGADILDIGAQSTRPGSTPIGAKEELHRILPVLTSLKKEGAKIPISIDTYNSEVAEVCLGAGAEIVNDVSSFRMDPRMPDVVAKNRAGVICMHFLESIHPMPVNPVYRNVLEDVKDYFKATLQIASRAGIAEESIVLDPGIGFGKTLENNLTLMKNLSFFADLNKPLLVGPSNKSFIGKISEAPLDQRIEGTAAAIAVSILHGAHIVRVHDVAFCRKFCDVLDAFCET